MQSETTVVIGTGPAGMRAALALVEHGVRPTVIDESPAGGGQIYRRAPGVLDGLRATEKLYGFEAVKATKLHRAFDAIRDQIDYRPSSTIWSVDAARLFFVGEDGAAQIEWDRLILATGAMDRIIPVKGWTLPGAFSLGGSQIALKAQAATVGKRVIFFGTGPLLYLVAYQYAKAGVEVAAVLDTSPLPPFYVLPPLFRGGATFAKGLYYLGWLMAHGIRLERGIRPLEILEGSDGAVSGFRYATVRGDVRTMDAQAVAFGYGLKSETQIADLLGLDFAFDPVQRQWLPVQDSDGRSSCPHVYLAGDGARVRGADVAELTGERAALALLADDGRENLRPRIAMISRRIHREEPFRKALERAFPFPVHLAKAVVDDVMLCRCEGLTAQRVRAAISETGECEINRLKAFTRLGMGRCQGRVCMPAALEIAAAAADIPLKQIGRVRGQAPIKPITIAELADSRP